MSGTHKPVTFRGKNLGIVVLVAAQLLIGFIHVVFGLWLLSAPRLIPFIGAAPSPDIYSIYTILFGLLTLIFAGGLWLEKQWGWVGTVAVAIFVIIADTLTLLDLPSIPGIPKVAGFGEITYSVIVLLYLSQPHVRTKYKINKK